MALLAVQGMAVSTAGFPSHHHGAVSSSSFGLSATVSFSRSRTSLAATAVSAPLTPVLDVYCGRGDRKTRRGKRFSHSYGNVSPLAQSQTDSSVVILIPLYGHVRPAPVTRRREQAQLGCTPRQRLPERTSSKTGRLSQSRLMTTSWKGWTRLSEFSLISRFPRLV
ncbi:unnamed protein product [Alopecurus aequalis]